jgi:hypothetical protein
VVLHLGRVGFGVQQHPAIGRNHSQPAAGRLCHGAHIFRGELLDVLPAEDAEHLHLLLHLQRQPLNIGLFGHFGGQEIHRRQGDDHDQQDGENELEEDACGHVW